MSPQQRAARPSASDPLSRRPAASWRRHSASGRVLATRPAGTKWRSKASCTVELAVTATIWAGSADSVPAAGTSSKAQMIVSRVSRAAVYSVPMSPQPVTQGEVPSSR